MQRRLHCLRRTSSELPTDRIIIIIWRNESRNDSLKWILNLRLRRKLYFYLYFIPVTIGHPSDSLRTSLHDSVWLSCLKPFVQVIIHLRRVLFLPCALVARNAVVLKPSFARTNWFKGSLIKFAAHVFFSCYRYALVLFIWKTSHVRYSAVSVASPSKLLRTLYASLT